MSFLNLIGGGRRTPAPSQPIAATANPEAVHAQLSKPSRQASIDSLAPAMRSKSRPSRSQADSASSTARPPSHSSRSSAVDSLKKPFTGKEGGGPSSRGLSPAVSQLSLVETLDGEITPKEAELHSKSSVIFPKAPTLLEQEWMDVGNGSSDEDDFLSDDDQDTGITRKDRQKPSKPLVESLVLVEDEQVKAHRLTEELAATQEKLSELKKQHGTLQTQLNNLEKENTTKASQLRLAKEINDADKIKVARENAATMEAKQREIHDLQRSLEALQHESKAWEERVEMLVKENEVLRKEVTSLEDQNAHAEEEVDAVKREVEAANTALRTFKERSKSVIASEREESMKLRDKASDFRRQLEALEKRSREREEEFQDLRASSNTTEKAFRVAQTTVDEKDRVLSDAQRHVEALEKQVRGLQEKVVEMEAQIIEGRNAAQRLLAKTKEDHKHETSLGNDRIKSLENELATYSSSIQQLRTSLRASHAEAEGATKLVESRAADIADLQQQISILEDELHSKEQELIDTKAVRASQSHLEEKIHSLNGVIERLKSDHAVENHHLDVQTTKERARVSQLEKEVSASHERNRELRGRLEISEQSRRMLRDQVTRREEEGRKDRRDSLGSSINLSLSSSIIQDPAQSPNDQVYTLLRSLNYEIFQTAALLADSLCNIPRPSGNTTSSDLADEETTSLLGSHLLSLLRSQSNTPLDTYDPYPLQTAIQATLVYCATRVMTAWYPGHWDHSDFLAATYTRIREAEGIAASDTWKAMTRARLRPTTTTVVRVVDFLEECLDTIFRCAGWPAVNTAVPSSSSSSSSSSSGKTVESLLRDHREKLSALSRHSLRLNVLLDSVNPQLEPAFVEPGSVFDSYVMDCDDGNSGSRRPTEDDEVVSTSEIGLRKVAIENRGGITNKRRIVLRPKVILKSSFEV